MSEEGVFKERDALLAVLSQSSRSGSSEQGFGGLAAALILLASFAVLPVFHAVCLFGFETAIAAREPLLSHILLNCALTALVLVSALRFKGRLDRKIRALLTRVILVHGALAFIILVSRQYYSNQVMLTAAGTSVILGLLVVGLAHRKIGLRVALLGATSAKVGNVAIPCDQINDPNTDLRPYDVVLTAGVVELSPEWAPALTRAMLAGKTIRHLAEYVEEMVGVVSVDHFDLDHLQLGGITSYRVRKRISDILFVILSLPVALPILLLGMIAVRASMGGPVFFVQTRVGMAGKPFRMYKLRTMRDSLPHERGTATAQSDARVTKVGAALRRFRVDELPQLWNVLKGDMSLIGPRPEQPGLTKDYIAAMPAFAYRSLVRPGITGWAQVNAGYAANVEETRVKLGYDLFYVKNFSFALDVQVLIRTVSTVLGGGGVR